MHRDDAIEILNGVKAPCQYAGDLDAALRASELNDAISVAVRDIAFCASVGDSVELPRFGRWKKVPAGMTPGGTPMFVCARCGGAEHLHGAEYPGRKVLCGDCGAVNFYPWEKLLDLPGV